MAPKTQAPSPRNKLLQAFGADELAKLQPSLTPVALPVRRILEGRNQPIEEVVFIESGLGSNVASTARREQIEVGIFGQEGMSGIPVILGDDRWQQECFIQLAGKGLQMRSDDLREAMQASPKIHQVLLRYVQTMMIQMASTAYANGRGRVDERLARWLLMTHDRVDGDEVPLTHEFLAMMLGVRRPGVTEALHVLEGRGAIRMARGSIMVIDRARLEESSAGLYGVAETEYQRLLG